MSCRAPLALQRSRARVRNASAADLIAEGRALSIAHDHPAGDDALIALVVTRRRHA